MSVELGPGLITSIYDGIQRPLDDIMKISGNNLKRGVEVASLKRDKKWEFVPVAKAGDEVEAGDVLGTVQETIVVQQKIMVPYGVKGTVKEIKAGAFTVEEAVAVIATEKGQRTDDDAEMAGSKRPSVSEEAAAGKTTGNRAACNRYILPNRQRWCGSRSGTFRKRQDSYPTPVG